VKEINSELKSHRLALINVIRNKYLNIIIEFRRDIIRERGYISIR
jgi:hypothetical protein